MQQKLLLWGTAVLLQSPSEAPNYSAQLFLESLFPACLFLLSQGSGASHRWWLHCHRDNLLHLNTPPDTCRSQGQRTVCASKLLQISWLAGCINAHFRGLFLMLMFFLPILFDVNSKLHKVRDHQSCNFANFIEVVCVRLWHLETSRVTELVSVWGDIFSQWCNPGEATWADVQEVLSSSLQGQIGMCILPLIYVFICTAHLNKRASREATSTWQRSHFLMQENCFLAS